MCILVYDEDKKQRIATVRMIEQANREADYETDVYSFDDPGRMIECARNDYVDVAFISMEDRLGKGLFLARHLKEEAPGINLIPMSEKLRFGKELLNLRVSGFILGERTKDKVLDELMNLRY